MQDLTNRLIRAYQAAFRDVVFKPSETNDHFTLRAEMNKGSLDGFNIDQFEQALLITEQGVQQVYFDISVLPSQLVHSEDAAWKNELAAYIDDGRGFEQNWTATVRSTIAKAEIVTRTGLSEQFFRVIPIFLFATLEEQRRQPYQTQLGNLFPDPHRKTGFVILDGSVFCDGPFLAFSDWDRIGEVSQPGAAFASIAGVEGVLTSECTWRGIDRVYVPEMLELARTEGDHGQDLREWSRALKALLSVFAMANVVDAKDAHVELTFWGLNRRQVFLNGTTPMDPAFVDQSAATYNWIYHETPHTTSALRISRSIVAQNLGEDARSNLAILQAHMGDIRSSAKVNYEMFVQEKLKDFFDLHKQIDSYVLADADFVNTKLRELRESLSKTLLLSLTVIVGALASTKAVEMSPLTSSAILLSYAAYLLAVQVWYFPREAENEFSEHLHLLSSRVEPYLKFLDRDQTREFLHTLPSDNQRRFTSRRAVVQTVSALVALVVICLAGYDLQQIAKSFVFEPSWALGRWINWVLAHIRCQG